MLGCSSVVVKKKNEGEGRMREVGFKGKKDPKT